MHFDWICITSHDLVTFVGMHWGTIGNWTILFSFNEEIAKNGSIQPINPENIRKYSEVPEIVEHLDFCPLKMRAKQPKEQIELSLVCFALIFSHWVNIYLIWQISPLTTSPLAPNWWNDLDHISYLV